MRNDLFFLGGVLLGLYSFFFFSFCEPNFRNCYLCPFFDIAVTKGFLSIKGVVMLYSFMETIVAEIIWQKVDSLPSRIWIIICFPNDMVLVLIFLMIQLDRSVEGKCHVYYSFANLAFEMHILDFLFIFHFLVLVLNISKKGP